MSEYVDDVPQYDDQKENTGLASISHILGLVFGLLGPIIIYAIAEDDFVKKNAAKAFTWQVFFLLYLILSFVSLTFFIGFLLFPVVLILNTAFCIIGAVKASNGKVWKYPGTIDLLEKSEEQTSQRPRNQRGQKRQERTRQQETRVSEDLTEEKLKQMYIDGEISEEEFDRKLDKIQKREQMERDYN